MIYSNLGYFGSALFLIGLFMAISNDFRFGLEMMIWGVALAGLGKLADELVTIRKALEESRKSPDLTGP